MRPCRPATPMDHQCPVCLEQRCIMVTTDCGHGCCGECMVSWYEQCQRSGKLAHCMHCRAVPRTLFICFGDLFDGLKRSIVQINNIFFKNASNSKTAIDLTDECQPLTELAARVAII